jgi:hypothetical protein
MVSFAPTTQLTTRIFTDFFDSNKADLKLLEEMGVTPKTKVRDQKPTLRSVGYVIMATVRMRKMQEAWSGNKKLHETLMKKLDGMRRKQGKAPLR